MNNYDDYGNPDDSVDLADIDYVGTAGPGGASASQQEAISIIFFSF